MKHDPGGARPLWQTFLVFLGPMMLSNVLQSLSGTLNNVFLGQMIGGQALAAATVFFPMLFFFLALVIGMGAGSSVLIGQAWGAGEIDKVKAVAGATLSLCLGFGLVVGLIGGTFAGPLIRLLGTPADIQVMATQYARIILFGMPSFFVFILATSMLRGVGDTVTPLWALAFSATVGLLLTPALIQGWLGLPKLGASSAAVASIVSQLAALAWMAWLLLRKHHPLAPDRALLAHMKPDWGIVVKVLRIGVPTAVQMVTVAVSELALVWLVNSHGSTVTAAYGVINQIIAYVQFPAMSIAISTAILGAQAIGAGRADRLPAVMRAGQAINFVLTGGGIVVVYVLDRWIVQAFIKDPAAAELTRHLLQIVIWSMIFFGAASVFGGVMRASGTVWAPMFLTILALLVVEVPVAYSLNSLIGVDGIWWAYPACFVAMFCLQGAFYALVWRRKRVERLI